MPVQSGLNLSLPYPHKGQQEILERCKRFNVLVCGRRWRKTTMLVSLAVKAAVQGLEVVWGSPSYMQSGNAMEETKRACVESPQVKFNESKMTCRFPGGGIIHYFSLDKWENVKGFTADLVIIDECQLVAEAAYKQCLRPMLIGTRGDVWLAGTPNGRNWFYDIYVRAMTRDNYAAFNAPTLGFQITDAGLVRKPHPFENSELANPEDEEEFYELFEDGEDNFRQEILAQFLENEGACFKKVIAAIDQGRSKNEEPQFGGIDEDGNAIPREFYWLGWDLAKVNDYSCVTVVNSHGKQVFFDRKRGMDYEEQIPWVEAIAKKYKAKIYMDTTNQSAVYEQMRRRQLQVVPFHFTNSSKNRIVENLQIALEQSKLRLMDIPVQTQELLSYEYKLTKEGKYRTTSAPSGKHDDTVMSLCLAVLDCIKAKKKNTITRGTATPEGKRRWHYA